MNRSIVRRVFAALLAASTINGGLAHAAMASVLAGNSPPAVHQPVKHDRLNNPCGAGSKRLPCPLCSQSCSDGIGMVADAAAFAAFPPSATGSITFGGLPATRPNRNQPIRAPPQPLFQG